MGFKSTVSELGIARAHTDARAIGLARGALEDVNTCSHKRFRFGQPIAGF